MKKANNKAAEIQLLELLKKVLPKATHDATLAGKIYQAVEHELKAKAKELAFEKFCAKVELPDLEPGGLRFVNRNVEGEIQERQAECGKSVKQVGRQKAGARAELLAAARR